MTSREEHAGLLGEYAAGALSHKRVVKLRWLLEIVAGARARALLHYVVLMHLEKLLCSNLVDLDFVCESLALQ